jgi:hypothetical protein
MEPDPDSDPEHWMLGLTSVFYIYSLPKRTFVKLWALKGKFMHGQRRDILDRGEMYKCRAYCLKSKTFRRLPASRTTRARTNQN